VTCERVPLTPKPFENSGKPSFWSATLPSFCAYCCALTFAHRARCAAAIFLRAARLILRTGLDAWDCFAFAHRARWAAAILARPAALMRRRRLGLTEV